MRWREALALSAPLAMALSTSTASATTDMARLSVGTGMGVSIHAFDAADGSSVVTGDISARVRLLYFLGLEFAYAPTDRIGATDDGPAFDSRTRLSALLHLVPTRPLGLFLKAGIGGAGLADALRLDAASSSYHGGVGLLVYVAEHWVVAGEFLLLIPGFNQWNTDTRVLAEAVGSAEGPLDFDWGKVWGASAQRVGLSLHYIF